MAATRAKSSTGGKGTTQKRPAAAAGTQAGKRPEPRPRKPTAKPRKAAAASKRRPPTLDAVITTALDDMKAVNVRVLDVRGITDIADTMVIASGTSDRHVRSIADRIVESAKKAGYQPMGVEGAGDGEWVLVDLQDVIVHVMLPRIREFYRLESLWELGPESREVAAVPE
ncbi:MAG TPA: ribosome silencing factor [Steroidobacteraceae bacterium]|nr:ribosome silencing factor [Steroidobacteraceae bacterium]